MLLAAALVSPARADEEPCVTCWSANCPEGAAMGKPTCAVAPAAAPVEPVEPEEPAAPEPAPPPPPPESDRLRRACLAGSVKSCARLGHDQIRDARQLTLEGIGRLDGACRQGEASACVELADLYLNGAATPPDPDRPHQLLEMACRDGDAQACTRKAAFEIHDPPPPPPPGVPEEEFHAHVLLGGGLDTSLPTLGRHYTLATMLDDGRTFTMLAAMSFEHLGAHDDARRDTPVAASLSNLSLASYLMLGAGPLRLGVGLELDHATADGMLDGDDSAPARQFLARAAGFAGGGSLAGGLTIPLGPVHLFFLARYRMIFGPAEGGWFLDLLGTFEQLNCSSDRDTIQYGRHGEPP